MPDTLKTVSSFYAVHIEYGISLTQSHIFVDLLLLVDEKNSFFKYM